MEPRAAAKEGTWKVQRRMRGTGGARFRAAGQAGAGRKAGHPSVLSQGRDLDHALYQ